MNSLTTIGQNIKKYRELKLIKQESLAKHLGITKGRMSQIENGLCAELTLIRLQKVAEYLNVHITNLLGPPPPAENDNFVLLSQDQLQKLVFEVVQKIKE